MEEILTSLWSDLQKYKDKPDANEKYIEKQERRITSLMAFWKSADAAILEAEEQIKEAFRKGLQQARKEQEQPFDRWNPAHKEDYRSYSIHLARTKWPELY